MFGCCCSTSISGALCGLHQIRKICRLRSSTASHFNSGILSWLWLQLWRLDARYLILFYCIYQFLDSLLQEFDFVHFGLLVLFDPRLDGEQPRLVQLLRLDQHVHPELLLPLQILDDGLVVDQVLLVFREVLSAHILYLLDFAVILEVNVIIALIYFAGFISDSFQGAFVILDNSLLQLVLDEVNFAVDFLELLSNFRLQSCFQVLHTRIHHSNAVIEFRLFNIQFILRFFFIRFGCLVKFRNLNLNVLLKVLDLIVFKTMRIQKLAILAISTALMLELLLKVIDLIIVLLGKVVVLDI